MSGIQQEAGKALTLDAVKRKHVRRVVDRCEGDCERATALLGIPVGELQKWLVRRRGLSTGGDAKRRV